MNKYILIALAVIIYFGGMFTHYKLQKAPTCPECPDMKCPPAVTVQQLDMSSIKKLKGGLTYAPVFNGDVYMNTDSIKK